MWQVGRELRRQGYPGWRPVAAACKDIPTALVQYYVGLFKAGRNKRIKNRIKKNQVLTQVLAKNAIWTQDGTHLGRMEKHPVEGQVIKDRGPLKTIAIDVGEPASADTVVQMLDKNKQARGLPFVFSTDNGPNYCSETVEAYLEQEKIIHLRSLTYTPQNNGAAEIGIREIKKLSHLGKGVMLNSAKETADSFIKSAAQLNENRLLATKGFKTANDLDETLPVTQNKDRNRFYTICMTRIQQAAAQAKNAREARRFEREMIFCTLEDFGLIKRQRGGKPYVMRQTEIFS